MQLILDALGRHSVDRPNTIAHIDQDGSAQTWFAIADHASRIQATIEQLTEPGSSVAITIPSGWLFWATVLGVSKAGRLPVLVPHPLPKTITDRIALDLGNILLFDTNMAKTAESQRSSAHQTRDTSGVILLSSGTTGHSRFILRSSNAIDRVAATLVHEEISTQSDICPSFLPMAHAYGFEHSFLAPILSGARVHTLGSFSIEVACAHLSAGATSLALVPATAASLAENPPHAPQLRSIVVAGSALHPLIRQNLERAFPLKVIDLYGTTETGTIWLDRGQGGRLVAGVTARIIETHQNNELIDAQTGSEGEIAIQSDAMSDEIVTNHGERVALHSSGFFRTGDIGIRSVNGTYRITGRAKLVFDVAGLKVNPIEIEQAIEMHPAIARALIHPIRLNDSLNRIGLQVELRENATTPTIQDLRSFLTPLVASHALPRTMTVHAELPKTKSGKLIREIQHEKLSPVVQRPDGLRSKAERDAYTNKLFAGSAAGYDSSSGVSFLGSGRWYRRRMLLKCGLRPGASHLDIGSGTGLTASLAQRIVGETGRVVALDPNAAMLEIAKRRGVHEVVCGHAENLPFEDNTFDFISMTYMLRHIENLSSAFSEARRVLRPGGRILILEVTRPEGQMQQHIFRFVMNWCVPSIGVIASARPATFPMMRYWSQTIDKSIPTSQIVAALDQSGFVGTRHQRELSVFSSYRGIVPAG
ncbi:MAG: AMP-binding protein [Planctomycetota bacterium]|nr:AMP-binding protein [Planctomycetota bacterium]MDA1262658.1 AMP-binding protein [Planctomycetota bacterium]